MGTHPFPYRLIRSNRKTLAIQVSASGQVTVRAPRTMSDTTIENFLTQKESWILKHLSHALISAAAIIWNLPAKYSKEKPQPTPTKWT